jgi:cytoplasmic iron level regulating protein YaaA (DUF328/UPF0246 family)
VQELGFKLPEFIDYSYDAIQDNRQRMEAYFAEVNRILSIPIEQWRKHYSDNIKMLRQNQLMFHHRAYDKVDLKELLCRTNENLQQH